MKDKPGTPAAGKTGRSARLAAALLVAAGLGIFAFRTNRDGAEGGGAELHSDGPDSGGERQAGHAGESSRERSARSEREPASAGQRAQALLRVKGGEVGMIGISAAQYEAYLGTMVQPGAWSEIATVSTTLLSRSTVADALKSAIGGGENMKAAFSPGEKGEYAGNNLEVKITALEVHEDYTDFQTEMASGDTTIRTTVAVPAGAVMMFRSRDDPHEGVLLVTAIKDDPQADPVVPMKTEGE